MPRRQPDHAQTVFEGKLFRVSVEQWGETRREVVHHPGACAIVALTDDREVVLIRQFREALREPLVEIPAGVLDLDGEDPGDCAVRELLEETGYRASEVRPLGVVHSSAGFSDERIELFAARATRERDPGEDDIEVTVIPFVRALADVDAGRITDAKTVVALLMTARRGPLGLS